MDNPQFIAAVKKVLRTVTDKIKNKTSTPNASDESDNHADQANPEIPPEAVVPTLPPPSPKHCEITANIKRDSIDWWTLRLEGVGLFVLIVYTIFTGMMYFANRDAANAAQSAATTAKEAIHLSERAYITIALSQFDVKTKTVVFSATNSGKIASGGADVIVHAFIINSPDPGQPMMYLKDAIEMGWKRSHYASIPIGTPFHIIHVFKKMDESTFDKGKQHVIVVGFANYNDGFPDTPSQQSTFCMDAIFNTFMKRAQLTPCDAAVYLPAAEIADGYPNNEDQ
jgi:archaellum component FlaF (FlaF/FlaG flagellin family)